LSLCTIHSHMDNISFTREANIAYHGIGVSITGYPVHFLGTGPGPGPGSTGSQFSGPGTGTGWEPVPNRVPGYPTVSLG